MIDIRAAWFEECGGPPPGNKRKLSCSCKLACDAPLVSSMHTECELEQLHHACNIVSFFLGEKGFLMFSVSVFFPSICSASTHGLCISGSHQHSL